MAETFTMEAQVHTQTIAGEICGGKSGTGRGFPSEYFGFLLSLSFH